MDNVLKEMVACQELLDEIIYDLPEKRSFKCPNCKFSALLHKFEIIRGETEQQSLSDMHHSNIAHPVDTCCASSPKKKPKSSHRYLKISKLHEISDEELERHIKNLRSSISKAKEEERKLTLTNKLKALRLERESRRNN